MAQGIQWYKEEVRDSILDYLEDSHSFDWEEWIDEPASSLRRYLSNDATLFNHATGSADGSYYCNSSDAQEAVIENGLEVLEDMCEVGVYDEAYVGREIMDRHWETLDMDIRRYIFPYALEMVMQEVEDELTARREAAVSEDEEDEE